MPNAARPAAAPDRTESWLRREASFRRPVAERVQELLQNIRSCDDRKPHESWDDANERHVEEFIARLRAEFPGAVAEGLWPPLPAPEVPFAEAPRAFVYRQTLPPMARRTTRFNYIFRVPGDSPEELILIAHYDTWRGPGADDNTTGEEITKQYLLDDLRAPQRPALTHLFILAGSEECGLIGLTSQLVLAFGLAVANIALMKGIYLAAAIGLAMVPLAKFRFGVSGSREYVRSLSAAQMAQIKSVVSVDSVGEGRMYIPSTSLGADFVRAFIPFEGYKGLNELLQEAAHLNAIKYNTLLTGGTTDHLSFLEVNSSLRDRLADWLDAPRWLGTHRWGPRKIPAAAVVAMCPGKASPLVFGGKLHTPADTPDRVYPEPLGEALRVVDYWYYLMQGGVRIQEPRDPGQYHYAQLFRVRPAGPKEDEYWLVLKDALEPNRRNINGVYRVEVEFQGARAVCRNAEILNWGVHTRLKHEVSELLEQARGAWERITPRQIEMQAPAGVLHFATRRDARAGAISALWHTAVGKFERFLGSNTFVAFFAAAYLMARGVDFGLDSAFARSVRFQQWFFDWLPATLPATILLQLALVLWLIGTKIPTWIDNNYRNLNKADNLRSLRRVASA